MKTLKEIEREIVTLSDQFAIQADSKERKAAERRVMFLQRAAAIIRSGATPDFLFDELEKAIRVRERYSELKQAIEWQSRGYSGELKRKALSDLKKEFNPDGIKAQIEMIKFLSA